MKKTLLIMAGAFALATMSPTAATAQGENQKSSAQTTEVVTHRIVMTNGKTFEGVIVARNPESLVLRVAGMPDLLVSYDEIDSMEKVATEPVEEVESVWFDNPNSTRYLFAPSAFNLRKGEAYYQNTLLLLNSFNYGITDWLSIGGGFEFITTIGTLSGSGNGAAYYITPKASMQVAKNWRAGVGVLHLNVPGLGDKRNSGGVTYGVVTYGNADNNVTMGLGSTYSENGFSKRPTMTLSGMYRVRPKVAFITENWFYNTNAFGSGDAAASVFDQYRSVHSYGIRFFGESVAVDLALVNNSDIVDFFFIGLPFVNFVLKI